MPLLSEDAGRRITRRAALAGGALFAPGVLRARAASATALNITAYDGFVPPEVAKQFQSETGIQLRVRLAASQAPELTLLVTERDHPLTDICTVVGGRLHQFVANGIIEPLDTSRLKNWYRINPLYSEAEWNHVDGAIVSVPLVIGANVLVSDINEVSPAPDSWAVMFDPKYRGRVTYDIEDFLLCTMALQGADPAFVSYLSDPAKAARAVDAARDLLIRTKSQVVRYFDEGSELRQLLTGGDAVLAQTYASNPSKLIWPVSPLVVSSRRRAAWPSLQLRGRQRRSEPRRRLPLPRCLAGNAGRSGRADTVGGLHDQLQGRRRRADGD